MRFLSESKGKYLIEQDGVIVAEVYRVYKSVGKRGFWTDGYHLQWYERDVPEHYRNLAQIGRRYNFSNKPGYMRVLK